MAPFTGCPGLEACGNCEPPPPLPPTLAGHPPEGVYTVPQLLWQFYLVPLDSTLNITAGPCFCIARCGGLSLEAFTAANRPIPQACFPRGRAFTNIASASPEMGTHLVDFEAPELAALLAGGDGAAAWNYSVQWGAFDGEVGRLWRQRALGAAGGQAQQGRGALPALAQCATCQLAAAMARPSDSVARDHLCCARRSRLCNS